jgi:adenylosuccinate lyase
MSIAAKCNCGYGSCGLCNFGPECAQVKWQTMQLKKPTESGNAILAISPIDGRYDKQTDILSEYFSEYALIKYRVKVEIHYLISLIKEKIITTKSDIISDLERIYINFSIADAFTIKEIEKETNHDVKAVEYFLKDKIKALDPTIVEFIHIGLTSQDINNTAIPLLWKDAIEKVYKPFIIEILEYLESLSREWFNIPMLARTHGQPASPTTIGKEILVFVERLESQLNLYNFIPYSCKFGGATGNFNSLHVAYPNFNWTGFANHFCYTLGLNRTKYTTQIEPYDNLAAQFDTLKRINNILIDFCRDIWQYISIDYFKQKIKSNEVGSSAMPHKVNPIDFENAEGNLGIANSLYEHMSSKLPISRLQRDLTDSTVLRNIGVPLSHSYLSLLSIKKGLSKLILNEPKLKEDLDNNWAVVAEGIQTILRREGFPKPYEALKEFTRGKSNLSQKDMNEFIESLDISYNLTIELLKITPHNYTGII